MAACTECCAVAVCVVCWLQSRELCAVWAESYRVRRRVHGADNQLFIAVGRHINRHLGILLLHTSCFPNAWRAGGFRVSVHQTSMFPMAITHQLGQSARRSPLTEPMYPQQRCSANSKRLRIRRPPWPLMWTYPSENVGLTSSGGQRMAFWPNGIHPNQTVQACRAFEPAST